MNEVDQRRNPYVGLRPFFIDDSLYFFGREQQTVELLEILQQHRFLGVVGSSGSGKSSLVRAGLLPGLLGGFLVEDRDCWRIVQIKPGDAPIRNLAAGLLKAMGEAATQQAHDELAQIIRDGHTDAVVEFLTLRLENNANVFLLVDQFEEIFAFRGIEGDEGTDSVNPVRRKERTARKAEAADFVDLIVALADRREMPIYVALTMRTDFLGECDLFYGLPEALNRGRYLVPRMTRGQLRKAIAGPAMLMRTHIAPRLLDHLLNELGDRFDRLPVLQHALLRTWDKWEDTGGSGSIDLRHFELAGGLEGALNQDAEGALVGLDIDVTARVFKRLTDTDVRQRRVRSPARISELVTAARAERCTVEAIVRRFEENGRSFVHRSDDGKPSDPRVDISHESLIRQWDRLRNWVDEERQWRDEYRELVKKARKRERGEAAPLQEPELQAVRDWRKRAAPWPGWAQRYSVADGDFDSAMGYLDESVEVRSQNLAEIELRRRFEKTWSPLILVTEVVAGALVVQWSDLLKKIKATVDERLMGLKDAGELDRFWDIIFSAESLDLVGKVMFSGEWWQVLLFLGACVAANRYAKAVHRRFAFPRILRGLVLSGGRNPIEVKAKVAVAERQDAVVVHHTTYATTFRRVRGYLMDSLIHVAIAAVTIVPVGTYVGIFESEEEPSDASVYVWFALILIFGWLYGTLQVTSKRQATLGMRAVGIFRTGLNGERLSFARASAWYGYRFLSYVFYGLGFVSQPFTRKRQTFHDWMAGTVVLRRPPLDVAPTIEPNSLTL